MKFCGKIFQSINRNSLNIYILIRKKKLSLTKLIEIINNNEIEKVEAFSTQFNLAYYTRQYTKLDCIDEIIEYSSDKYYHLKEIRDIVNIDEMVDKIIDSKTYDKVFKFYYTRKLWKIIFSYQEDMKELYSDMLEEEKRNVFKQVMKNIDNYYIEMITK